MIHNNNIKKIIYVVYCILYYYIYIYTVYIIIMLMR